MTLIIINIVLSVLIAVTLVMFALSVLQHLEEESVSINNITSTIFCLLILSMIVIFINT